MTGVLTTSLVWGENFKGIYADDVNGIDIILSTPSQTSTYSAIDGQVNFIGDGDLHDTKYDHQVIELLLTDPELFGNASVPYTLRIYPNAILYDKYSTKNPTIATIVAVCIMVFTALMFTGYDRLVRREFHVKKELLKAKRHFMRYVSHEVRTPLNAVCMGLNLMQVEIQEVMESDDATIKTEKAAEWLDLAREVLNNAQGATCVLNDFLNYDKVQTGQLSLELSIIPIWDLIESTMSEFRLPAQNKTIIFDVNGADTNTQSGEDQEKQSQKVVGDKIRLSQVLRNLASNAIKFTPEGGNITVRAFWTKATVEESTNVELQSGDNVSLCQSGWLRLDVTDNGAGMTQDQLKLVFDSGTQFNVNKQQQGGGSGLGLYIAKGIVAQHNGTLTVTSKGLGHGTTFTVMLPLFHPPEIDQDDDRQPKATGGTAEARGSTPPTSSPNVTATEREPCSWLDDRDQSYRILVVDDAPLNRKLFSRLLTKRGHIVEVAENGLEACEKVEQAKKARNEFDSILMDFQMVSSSNNDLRSVIWRSHRSHFVLLLLACYGWTNCDSTDS
jgi:signal transduction histidine kinase